PFTCLTLLLALALVAYSSEDCVQVIRLKTGDVLGAGTDIQVSLNLYDAEVNRVGESNLWSKGMMGFAYDYFESGNLDYFSFKSNNCLSSPVCKIELAHDNSGFRSGWYVSYLAI
ncbi:hypothetical protein RND81_13G144600, partial [Saponaria officinalis]